MQIEGGEEQEPPVLEIRCEDLAVPVAASWAGHGEGVVEPSNSNQTQAVGFPCELADGVVAGDVIDGAELQGGHLAFVFGERKTY